MGAQDDLAVTFDHLDLGSRSVQSEVTPDRRGNSDDPRAWTVTKFAPVFMGAV